MRFRLRPTQWSLASAIVAVLTANLVGCTKCGTSAPPGRGLAPLTMLLPRTAQAVFLIPRLRSLEPAIQKLELLKLTTLAAQLQGFESGRDLFSAVVAQVAIDFRLPSALAKAGIDPEGAFALVIPAGGDAYAVIPVQDLARFHDALAAVARNRIGTAVETVSDIAGQKVTSFAPNGSPNPDLGFIVRAGFAFVAAAAMVGQLPGHAAIDAEQSLALEPTLAAVLKRSGATSLAYAWLSPRFAWSSSLAPSGVTLVVDITGQRLRVRAHAPWATGSTLSALEVQPPPSQSLLQYLPDDSFLVARFAGPPDRLGPMLQRLVGKAMDRAFDDVLANLAPGIIASLSLSPSAVLSSMPVLDVRQTNPFHFFHFVALASIRDREKARQLLSQSPALGSRMGVRIEERQEQGERIFASTYAQGEGAHLALVGQTAAIGSPLETLLGTVHRLKSPSGAAQGPLRDPKLRAELDGPAAMVIDLPCLASSIKNLPTSSWGVGGFAIRAAALRWLTALEDLRGLSVHVSGSEQILELEVSLHFAGT